jgi:hypothetical protein
MGIRQRYVDATNVVRYGMLLMQTTNMINRRICFSANTTTISITIAILRLFTNHAATVIQSTSYRFVIN